MLPKGRREVTSARVADAGSDVINRKHGIPTQEMGSVLHADVLEEVHGRAPEGHREALCETERLIDAVSASESTV